MSEQVEADLRNHYDSEHKKLLEFEAMQDKIKDELEIDIHDLISKFDKIVAKYDFEYGLTDYLLKEV